MVSQIFKQTMFKKNYLPFAGPDFFLVGFYHDILSAYFWDRAELYFTQPFNKSICCFTLIFWKPRGYDHPFWVCCSHVVYVVRHYTLYDYDR